MPYSTDDKVDNPVSLYAATKKSNELMAHVVLDNSNGKAEDIVLSKCYRNSRPVLITAHSLGFGIYRKKEAREETSLVQLFEDKQLYIIRQIEKRCKIARLPDGKYLFHQAILCKHFFIDAV